MFLTHYLHEIIRTPKNEIILLDVSDTPDCGWEGAYAIFDEDTFRNWWQEAGIDEDYTFEDICECGEEAEAFDNWIVVSNRHRSPEVAERRLRKAIANL